MILNTKDESGCGENCGDGGKDIAFAPDTEDTSDETQESGDCENTIEDNLVGKLCSSVVTGVLNILERLLTDLTSFVEINISFSIVQHNRFSVVTEFGDIQVTVKTLSQRFNTDIALLGGYRRHAGGDFFQSVFNLSHTVFKLCQRCFSFFQLLSAFSELLFTGSIISLTFCIVCITRVELSFAGCKIFLTISILLLGFSKLLFSIGNFFLASFECLLTIFILFELSFAIFDHVLNVLRKVIDIVWNVQTGILSYRTNNRGEPFLSVVKSWKSFQVAIAELYILVYIRHNRLNLSELLFTFVVGCCVGVEFLLTVSNLLFTSGEVFFTVFDLLLAVSKLFLTVGIVFLTFDEVFFAGNKLCGAIGKVTLTFLVIFYAVIVVDCTGKISVLVGSKLTNTIIQCVELFDDGGSVCLFHIILNGKCVLDAETSGD